MKFLIDAQLPRRLARELNEMGHDAIHTLDLPKRNATPTGTSPTWRTTRDASW